MIIINIYYIKNLNQYCAEITETFNFNFPTLSPLLLVISALMSKLSPPSARGVKFTLNIKQ